MIKSFGKIHILDTKKNPEFSKVPFSMTLPFSYLDDVLCYSYIQHKLQSIQNTLARIFTNHRKYAHVTPIMKQLHWLPVKYRCMFKTATLVYKYLHSGSPSYFTPFLSLSSCSYSTRGSYPGHHYLTVPLFRSSVFKSVKHFDRSFAFGAPKIWNELPHDVRSAASVASFRKKLKTYLFAKAYPP